jgi:hypothetical protein
MLRKLTYKSYNPLVQLLLVDTYGGSVLATTGFRLSEALMIHINRNSETIHDTL